MLKSLVWFFDIKGNSIEKANGGIGIIPYIYKDAYNYFYNLYLAHSLNQNKNISDYKPKEKVIEIYSPEVYVKPIKLFNVSEDDDFE